MGCCAESTRRTAAESIAELQRGHFWPGRTLGFCFPLTKTAAFTILVQI